MSYWLSKRRISTHVRLERGCLHETYQSFGMLRCPNCGEMYLVEHEHEYFYSRRDLNRVPHRMRILWDNGCFRCGHVDISHGCRNWNTDLEHVRASWWRCLLPARLRPNRHKRERRQRQHHDAALLDKCRGNVKACDACYFSLFPPELLWPGVAAESSP